MLCLQARKVSAAKTSVVLADKKSVASQDIPMALRRQLQRGRDGNGIGMSWETADVSSAATTDAFLSTQQTACLQTQHTCLACGQLQASERGTRGEAFLTTWATEKMRGKIMCKSLRKLFPTEP